MRLVDLSHTIEQGLVTYPGLPAPIITPHLTREASRGVYAVGTEFAIDAITMVGNTGTYIDSPYHRYPEGPDLSGLDLASLVRVPAVVIDCRSTGRRGIGIADLDGAPLSGAAVLLLTGWDDNFGTESYAVDAPFLTEEGASHLAAQGATLVGIDSVNIDDAVPGGPRPAHTILLGAGIPVVEHLTGLQDLPATGALFTAVPPKVRGFGTFPVRAFAEAP